MINQLQRPVGPADREPDEHPDEAPPAAINGVATRLQEERHRHAAFVATLAHELRQPLSILSNATEALNGPPAARALGKTAEIMQRQIQHMSRLLTDAIESAQWARGTTLLRRERVDVRDVIAATQADVSGIAAARRHRLIVSPGQEALWVNGDPARLRQVLSNLFDNAIKFTEPGGVIRVTAGRNGRDVTIRVSDTGRGFRPGEATQIFELFSQLRPGEDRGLGIGLNVAASILAGHGGRIEARSAGPAHGTEFVVTLPLARVGASVMLGV